MFKYKDKKQRLRFFRKIYILLECTVNPQYFGHQHNYKHLNIIYDQQKVNRMCKSTQTIW